MGLIHMLKVVGNVPGFVSGNSEVEAVLEKKGYKLYGLTKGACGLDMRDWRRGKSQILIGDGNKGVYDIDNRKDGGAK